MLIILYNMFVKRKEVNGFETKYSDISETGKIQN